MSIKRQLKGYTFIEILAVTAIFSGMMIIAVATFSVASSHETAVSNRRLVHQSARISVDAIVRELAVSKNQYNEDGTLVDGGGAFVITMIDNLGSWPPPSQSDETIGDSVIIRTTNKTGNSIYHAYYLCQRPNDSAAFSLVMKDLGAATNNFANNWSGIKTKLDNVDVRCSDVEQMTTNEVKIPTDDGLKVSGYFPQTGLSTQPRATVTLTAQNARGTRAEEWVLSTYRATAIHRDYGQY